MGNGPWNIGRLSFKGRCIFIFESTFTADTDADSDGDSDEDTGSEVVPDTDPRDTQPISDTESATKTHTALGTDEPPDSETASIDTETARDSASDVVYCIESKLPDEDVFFEFYEFCVEDNAAWLEEVREILAPIGEENYDASSGSAGMIGCSDSEYLFYGIPRDTSRDILCALTLLPYIDTIGGGVWL